MNTIYGAVLYMTFEVMSADAEAFRVLGAMIINTSAVCCGLSVAANLCVFCEVTRGNGAIVSENFDDCR